MLGGYARGGILLGAAMLGLEWGRLERSLEREPDRQLERRNNGRGRNNWHGNNWHGNNWHNGHNHNRQ